MNVTAGLGVLVICLGLLWGVHVVQGYFWRRHFGRRGFTEPDPIKAKKIGEL